MPDVLTAFSQGKRDDPDRNEDMVVTTADFFAVIDGATAKSRLVSGKSPGRRAAESVAEAILGMPATVGVREAVDHLSAALAAPPHLSGAGEIPSAGALLLSAHRNEIWVVGDGWAAWDDQVRRFSHEVEARAAAARAALLRAELERTPLAQLLGKDPGRDMILPLLEREHLLANIDRDDSLGFGRLDGRRVPDRYIRVLALPEKWSRVVLASDGYPALGATFEESEELLEDRLRRDPLMISDPPGTKGVGPGQLSFDDRSWLEISR